MFSVLPGPFPQRIPLDVVHDIINQLHDDLPARKSCSLVCWEWLPICRRCLLVDIPCSGHRLPEFFDLLTKPSSSFSKYTRRLFIHGNYILAPAVPSEYPQLPITSLFLYDIEAECIPANLPSIFSVVTFLELYKVDRLTLADLARMFFSFPCLQTFSFNDVLRRGKEYEKPESNLDLPMNLQSMNVCCKKLTTFLDWFLSRKNIPQLTTLRLHGVERSDIEAITRLLQVIGNSLEHLELGLRYFQYFIKEDLFPHHYRQISLTHTPQLRSLKLVESELLPQLLRSGAYLTHLEQVTVAITVKGLYNVKNTGTWKELNRVIMDPQTTLRLRSFTIVVDIISQSRPAQIMDEPLKLTEVEAVIRREMSWCDSRGIVRIVPDTRIEDSKKGSLIHRLSWTKRFLK